MKKTKRKAKRAQQQATELLSFPLEGNDRGLHLEPSMGGYVSPTSIKSEAPRLVEQRPDDATWDDLMYEIYVRQAIESSLKDSQEGRMVPVAEVRRQLGLPT